MSFANIVPLRYLPRGVDQMFTYSVPESLKGEIIVGRLVIVPFHKKNIQGVIYETMNKTSLPKASVYALRSILPYPPLTEDQRYLIDNLERYYGASRTLAYKIVVGHLAVNPPPVSQKSKQKFKWPATPLKKNLQTSWRLLQSSRETILTGALYDPRHSIFLEYLRKRCGSDGQALCVFPDNGSASIARMAYEKYFGSSAVTIWRSTTSLAERSRRWLLIEAGQIRIVLATRHGVFLPFQNLQAIILFDGADDGYKSWDQQPYYDTRYLTAALAKHKQISFLTTRILPPLSVSPSARVLTIAPLKKEPRPLIIDRQIARQATAKSLIPEAVLEIIAESRSGDHCLIFANRLGYAVSFCQDCGYIARCSKCRTPLSIAPKRTRQHESPCYRCGKVSAPLLLCPKCQGARFRYFGLGVERVFEELTKLFPARKIQRLERATVRNADALQKALNAIRERHIDITVTTSIILPRLWSLPRSRLVAALRVEGLFLTPDWRANERSLSILQQLWMAADRYYCVETSLPNHPVIKTLCSSDLKNFIRQETLERQQFNYPPFVRLIKLTPPKINNDKNTAVTIPSIVEDTKLRSICISLEGRTSTVVVKAPLDYPLPKLFRRVPYSWKIDVDPITLT